MMPPKGQKKALAPSNIFSIEGNIGSGKSTFLKAINKEFPQVEVLAEPLCAWQHVGENGYNLLEMYYKDPARWGLTFQNFALMTRVQTWRRYQQQQSASQIRVSQRSVLADRHIFASSMHDCGYLSDDQHDIYLSTFEGLNQVMGIKPLAGIIYLRCQPEVCINRIRKRNRSEEAGIPFDYLKLLHEKHENWLGKATSVEGCPKILVLDVSEDISTNEAHYAELLAQVRNFIGCE